MLFWDFAFLFNYDRKIQYLAGLCPEKWSAGDRNDLKILKNYVEHTFYKLLEEGKVIENDNAGYAVFNTGLFTEYYETIYAYFISNKNPGRQKWFFSDFFTEYQLANIGVTDKPERANYFSNPADLVFDTNLPIIPQYDHIFVDQENYERIPQSIRESPNRTMLFDGAVKRAKLMIDANYKTAVPQYHRGKIQILIPICLISENVPDLALVVCKNSAGTQYLGRTCLTLDMAYNNARLITRPDSAWLKP